MRRRLIVVAAVASVGVVAAVLGAARDASDTGPATAGGLGLGTRSVSAGEVQLTIAVRRLDDAGATFAVTLDTHSGDLDVDVAAAARLEVGATTWPVLAWDGDGPGGHHREGELRFRPAGAPAGTVRLRIGGFDEPVEVTWDLEARTTTAPEGGNPR